MSKPITITATVRAWLPPYQKLDDLLENIRNEKSTSIVSGLQFNANDLSWGNNRYTLVGEATIAVTLKPRDELTAARVQALQAELEAVRVESHRKQQAILDSISKLQALTNEVEA